MLNSEQVLGGHNIIVDNRMDSIDVDAALGTNHGYIFESSAVLNDLSRLILTEVDPPTRGLVRVPKAGWHYWRFPPI